MKFTASSTELQRMLSKLSGVLPTRSTMPILENILLDLKGNHLTMTATDLAVSLSVIMEVQDASDEGAIAVPAKRFVDTMRSLPDMPAVCQIDPTAARMTIRTQTGEYTLTGDQAKEYPQLPPFTPAGTLTFDSTTLRRIVHRTTFAVSADELRPAMMGVLFQYKEGKFRCVSTDGHRLVRLSLKQPGGTVKKDMIIPAKALTVVSRLAETGDVETGVSDTHVRFSFESSVLVSRLIDETYPNYESVIPPDNTKVLTVRREELIATIRRVALYSSASTHQIRLAITPAGVEVSAQDIDFGGEAKETLAGRFAGEPLEIGFNSTYLVDILTHLDGEEVNLKFSTPTRAAIATPAGNGEPEADVLMLVMPVRLSG